MENHEELKKSLENCLKYLKKEDGYYRTSKEIITSWSDLSNYRRYYLLILAIENFIEYE